VLFTIPKSPFRIDPDNGKGVFSRYLPRKYRSNSKIIKRFAQVLQPVFVNGNTIRIEKNNNLRRAQLNRPVQYPARDIEAVGNRDDLCIKLVDLFKRAVGGGIVKINYFKILQGLF